jgi:hypothetical protein
MSGGQLLYLLSDAFLHCIFIIRGFNAAAFYCLKFLLLGIFIAWNFYCLKFLLLGIFIA